MTNCIFFLFILALFANFSFGSIGYFGVNRTFTLMYRGLFENALKSIDEEGKACEPYYDEDMLIKSAEEYFALNLTRYVSSYTTSYYFFNKEDHSYCTNDYCRGVKISLKCDINYMFHYEKARDFYLLSVGEKI